MKQKNLLLVEGKDDEHVIYAIRDIYGIEKDTFKIKDKQGIDGVLTETDSTLVDGNSDICLGIVIDADLDLKARWQSVSNILRKAGYVSTPAEPSPNGTIIEQENKIKFGVWIMPDNQIYGMLEDFLSFLIPDKDTNQVWAKAVKCSQEVLNEVGEESRFGEIHLSKAQIHAYLAWQKECGKPFGISITAKYLQAENPNCENFVNWLKRLFEIK
jgi:hypothetical protein